MTPVMLPWTDGIEGVIRQALPEYLDEMREKCQRGVAYVLAWPDHGLTVSTVQLRDGIPELLVLAALGSGLADCIEGLKDHARHNGCRRVRAWSSIKGMWRVLQGLGFMAGRSDGQRREFILEV